MKFTTSSLCLCTLEVVLATVRIGSLTTRLYSCAQVFVCMVNANSCEHMENSKWYCSLLKGKNIHRIFWGLFPLSTGRYWCHLHDTLFLLILPKLAKAWEQGYFLFTITGKDDTLHATRNGSSAHHQCKRGRCGVWQEGTGFAQIDVTMISTIHSSTTSQFVDWRNSSWSSDCTDLLLPCGRSTSTSRWGDWCSFHWSNYAVRYSEWSYTATSSNGRKTLSPGKDASSLEQIGMWRAAWYGSKHGTIHKAFTRFTSVCGSYSTPSFFLLHKAHSSCAGLPLGVGGTCKGQEGYVGADRR